MLRLRVLNTQTGEECVYRVTKVHLEKADDFYINGLITLRLATIPEETAAYWALSMNESISDIYTKVYMYFPNAKSHHGKTSEIPDCKFLALEEV